MRAASGPAEVAELADAPGSGPGGVQTLWRFESSSRHRRQPRRTMAHEQQRQANMIEQQIRTWDVLDERVLAACRELRREDFVALAAHRPLAYADAALPLGDGGGRMLEPKLEARMLQALAPTREEKILHIGTGSGYFAALLGLLAGDVVSVEISPALAGAARERLEKAGARNVSVRCADGCGGLPEEAPFDAIVLTASAPMIPPSLWHQVRNGGRILAIVGDAPAMTLRLIETRGGDVRIVRDILETCVEPLVGAPQPERFRF